MRIVNTTPAAQYLNYRDGTVIAIEPMGYVIRPAGDLDYLDDSAVSLARFSSGQLVLRNDDGSAYTGTALPGSPVSPPAQAVTVGPAGYLQGSGATAAALSSAVSGAGSSATVDLCSWPWLKRPGDDITAVLQAIINTLTAGASLDIVISRPGVYYMNGPQQAGTYVSPPKTTTSGSHPANRQHHTYLGG